MTPADIDNIPLYFPRSMRKHFAAIQTDVPMFFEGMEKVTAAGVSYTELDKYIECRFTGPHTRRFTKNYSTHILWINLLITCNNSKDLDAMNKIVTTLRAGFLDIIQIYRLTGATNEALVNIGCARIESDGHNHIRIDNFGQLQDSSTIVQTTIEASYCLEATRDN